MVSNTVTGCTALINRALLHKALPVPADAVMHDWWLSLVASCFGQLLFVDKSLVQYRQHDRNTLGARAHTPSTFSVRTFAKLLQFSQSPDALRDVMRLPRLGLWGQRLLFRQLRRRH
jgi:hypothetical protein